MANKAKQARRPIGRSKRKAPVQVTGGGGFRFENSVAARFLLDLLTGRNSLGAEFGHVVRLEWQARDAGWLADDLAISSQTATGEERSAGLSVKSYQQLGRNGFHPDFSAIAWQQWLNESAGRHFKRGVDAIVLVTGDLADDIAEAWSVLHTQASNTASDRVLARIKADKKQGSQTSQLQRAIFDSLGRAGTRSAEQRAADANDQVLLVRDLRVIKLDYEAQPSADYQRALRDCRECLTSGNPEQGRRLWERLVGIADEMRPTGGSLNLVGLLSMLRSQFQLIGHPDYRADWDTLRRSAADVTANIADAINGNAHLARPKQITRIAERLGTQRACVLIGESGSGKSALAKRLSSERYGRTIWLSADDLDYKTSREFERAAGLHHPLTSLLISSTQPCLVVLDAVEGYSPDALGMAARLVRELFGSTAAEHVHVLLTVQSEAAAAVIRQLAQLGTPERALTTHTLPLPSANELDTLLSAVPQLSWIGLRPELRPLLTNLKVLEMTARTMHSEQSLGSRPVVGLTTLIDILWEDWVEHRDGGRSHVLKALATQEADKLSNGVSRQSLGFAEQQALPGLTSSGLVHIKDERVTFAHDLLGDWARLRVLIGDGPITASANQQRTQSPRWHKAIRLLGQRILEQADNSIDQWRQCVENIPDEPASGALIRDLFLDSLFLATNAVTLLERAWPVLIANQGALLRRLLKRFLFVATLPDLRLLALSEDSDEARRFAHAVRVPYWPYWAPVLMVLHAHRDAIIQHAPNEAASVCALWLRAMPFELLPGQAMPWRKEAAELAVATAREIQARNEAGSYWASGGDRTVYEAALYAARDLPAEVGELCLELAKRRALLPAIEARVQEMHRKRREQERQSQKVQRKARGPMMTGLPRGPLNAPWPDGPSSHVDRDFQEACLDGPAFAYLAQSSPDVALEVLLAVCIEDPQHDDYGKSSRMEDTGLAYWRQREPPMYFRGPFLQFLRVAPEQGLTFILRLVNFATSRYTGDRVGQTLEIDGQAKLWRGDARVFRWHHDWPLMQGGLLHSVLMALERWFYERIDAGQEVEEFARRIMAESESVAFAGVLFDVGKKLPPLWAGPLRPLFTSWVLWSWDFQVTMLRANGASVTLGYWGKQPQQVINLGREWYALPHRRQMLLMLDGAIARTMLSKPEFRPFFEEVRKRWKAALDAGEDPQHLGPLIERINPDNYTFSPEGTAVDFQWPEAMTREHERQLRQIGLDQALTQFPFQCRKLLAAGTPLSKDQLLPLLQWLQSLERNPPDLPMQDGEPIQRMENVMLGGIAVLVVLHLDWLLQDPNRIAWCRARLEAINTTPPTPSRFDSEVAVGDQRWDDFAAECGVRLLVADSADRLARNLVAQGVMGYHYGTTGLTMARAFAARADLGEDFPRLITLCTRWAALRVLSAISRDLGGEDKGRWDTQKASLLEEFLSGGLTAALPDLAQLNADTLNSYNTLYEKRHPEFRPRPRVTSTSGSLGREREKLYPERLGFDGWVITHGLAWLDPGSAQSDGERRRILGLIHELLKVSLATVPALEDPRNQEVEGLPTEFDGWIFEVVAIAVSRLPAGETAQRLWQAILDQGAPAHDWVERFFWAWFSTGLRAAPSPEAFCGIWRDMILFALASPKWQRATYGSYGLDSMVIELLGTDGRWGSLAADSTFAPVLGTLVDVFAKAAHEWFRMSRVMRNFLYFVVQPAAAQLVRPAIAWVSSAIASYRSYDWRDGLEEGLIEFLNACWARERQAILETPDLKDAFSSLVASVVSQGSHAAIALRDRIAGSTGA